MSDKQVWHYEQNGIFSTNSAYYLAKREVDAGTSGSNSQDSLILKKLWNACVPGKPETVEHVLRDCSMARAICGEFLAGLTAVEEDIGLALQEELLAARFVHATTSFIRREGNNAAYRLARAGLRGTWKSIWAENPPNMLADVLIEESSHRNLS
ncbi:hypothetical protein ACFX1Q_026404 [Malus domestica]